MDSKLLEALIADGESSTVEFKVAAPRYSDLAERFCGMANGLGGYVIMGVADKTWKIVGVKNIPETTDIVLRAARHCKPTVTLLPAQPEIVEVQGKNLAVVHIPPNDGTLYQAGGVFWIRRGTHTVPLEATEIETFLHRLGSLSWEKRPVELATLDDLDFTLIDEFASHRQSSRSKTGGRHTDFETLLLKSNCATYDSSNLVAQQQTNPASSSNLLDTPASLLQNSQSPLLRPTNAGLLLFGKAPREFIMQAEIVCILYADTLGLKRYIDRRNLHGTIAQQIDQAEEFLRKHIQIAGRIEGFHRIDEPDYPVEALREAVVNAVVHRDYSLEGESVRLFFYTDRVEIHSPGQLMPGISLAELKEGKVISRPRNPVLANVLRELPGGYMERLGSGISFMINQMRLLQKSDPQFREQQEFVVTFYKEQVATESAAPVTRSDTPAALTNPAVLTPPQQIQYQLVTAGDEGEDEKPDDNEVEMETSSDSEDLPVLNQNRRHMLALAYIQEKGTITNLEYRSLTGISESTAMRDLEALVELGTLRAVGEKRGRKYKR